MPQTFVLPRQMALDDDANPLSGALAYFFETNTNNPQAVYVDAALTTQHAHPVVADSAGRWPKIYLNPAASVNYRIRITTASGVQIDQQDDIDRFTVSQTEIAAAINPRTSAEIAAAVTPVSLLYGEGDARRYGMVGNDSNSNDTAFASLRAVAAQRVACTIPAGTYRYSTSPNWNIRDLHLRGERGTILKHTGSGVMFNIDGGAEGGAGLTYGIRLEDLVISGNANSTVGVYSRGAVHCVLRNIQVRNCTDKAFWIRHGVSNVYDTCIVTTNDEALSPWPDYGFYLDNNGTGYYTADCTFINCIAEGFGTGGTFEGTGCHLADASGCTFLGGTFEAVAIGLQISATSKHNKFDSVWMEENETNDIIDAGGSNTFVNMFCGSATSGDTVDIQGGGASFFGGFIRGADVDAISEETFFCGVTFALTVGITGTGAYRAVGCTKADGNLDISGRVIDVLGLRGSFTATLTGVDAVVTGTVRYAINGNNCTLEFPSISGTSNTTACTLTGMPESIRPPFAQRLAGWVFDNSLSVWGEVVVGTDGVITLSNGAGGTAFTVLETKGIVSNTISYRVD